MPLVQAACNVLIQLVNVLVMLVTKVPSVMLLVVAIPLAQVVQHVMLLRVNVPAILDTQVPHATLVTLTTTKQVMEHVQVCIFFLMTTKCLIYSKLFIFSLWM